MTAFLDHLPDPIANTFTVEQARVILGLRADPELRERIEVLRAKANDGTLTEEEDSEYKEFVEALDVISILQAKARKIVDQNAA